MSMNEEAQFYFFNCARRVETVARVALKAMVMKIPKDNEIFRDQWSLCYDAA